MKKGSFIITTEMLLWIGRLIFLIVVAFSIFFIVNSYIHREIDIKDLETDILITRLFYSPNCFVYNDTREYPGVIDLEKFTDERIGKCLNRTGFSAKLILNDLDGNKIAEVFNNKKEFDENKPLCKYENYKKNCVDKQRYTLIYDDGDLTQGILKVEMVIK